MKKLISLTALALTSMMVFGQTQVPTNSSSPIYYKDGKVGIGTNSPNEKLDVTGNANLTGNLGMGPVITLNAPNYAPFIQFKNATSTFKPATIYGNATANKNEIVLRSFYSGGYKDLIWNNQGKLSINAGWNTTEALEVGGNIKANNLFLKGNGGIYSLYKSNAYILKDHNNGNVTVNAAGGNLFLGFVNTGRILLRKGLYDTSGAHSIINENGFVYQDKPGVNNYFNGNVGIGTTSPDPNYKLDVAGTIRADEMVVEEVATANINIEGTLAANNITVKANGNTADFVFEDNYQLKDLSEVENYIKTHKHLPDIKSAEEMEKEGVNLAEMNKLLLQKVEELMLYSIDLEKKIKESNTQEFKVEKLEEKNNELNNRVNKLELVIKSLAK